VVAHINGEALVYVADADATARISFAAAQSRALSSPRRARELADQHPATYVAFDVLAHPAAGLPDLRPRPYVERRRVLLDVLADVGPPIVPVWSTTDLDEALLWYETLEGTGVEGIVAKPLRSAYKAGRVWCVDCTFSGSLARAIPSLNERYARPPPRRDRGASDRPPCRLRCRAGDQVPRVRRPRRLLPACGLDFREWYEAHGGRDLADDPDHLAGPWRELGRDDLTSDVLGERLEAYVDGLLQRYG
jgi:hypothetical protein